MGLARLQYRGVIGSYYERLQTVMATLWMSSVAMLVPTDQPMEEFAWIDQVPSMRKWVGGRQPYELSEAGIKIYTDLYENTLEVKVDDLRRDKSNQLRTRLRDLGQRTAEHWHKLLTAAIQSPGNSYDGTTYWSASHSERDSGTQKNLLTKTEVAGLQVVSTTAMTDLEAANSMLGVIAYMQSYLDSTGEPATADARSFLFMVPMNLYGPFKKALRLEPVIVSGVGKSNPLSAFTDLNIQIVLNPRLNAAPTVFYTFITDREVKPFICLEEVTGPDVEMDDSRVFWDRKVYYGASAIRGVGVGSWRMASKSTIAT